MSAWCYLYSLLEVHDRPVIKDGPLKAGVSRSNIAAAALPHSAVHASFKRDEHFLHRDVKFVQHITDEFEHYRRPADNGECVLIKLAVPFTQDFQ